MAREVVVARPRRSVGQRFTAVNRRTLFILLGIVILGASIVVASVLYWANVGIVQSTGSGTESVAYALLTDSGLDEPTHTSEVIAFNEVSGDIIARLPVGDGPNLATDPSGETLYLLHTLRYSDTNATDRLAKVDTRTWQETASVQVTSRVQYPLNGPSALALSPDGRRLVVYSTDVKGTYWLETFDATTLERLQDVSLPRGCGGTPVVTTRTEVVVLCGVTKEGNDAEGMIDTPLALHFVDLGASRVVASVSLPDAGFFVAGKPVSVLVSNDQETIYVVFNDLEMLEVDSVSHQVRRSITVESQSQMAYVADLTSNGELLVGLTSDYRSWQNMTLLRLKLPEPGMAPLSPRLIESLSIQQYPGFASGLDEEIYQWNRSSNLLRKRDLRDGTVWDIDLGGHNRTIAGIVRTGR